MRRGGKVSDGEEEGGLVLCEPITFKSLFKQKPKPTIPWFQAKLHKILDKIKHPTPLPSSSSFLTTHPLPLPTAMVAPPFFPLSCMGGGKSMKFILTSFIVLCIHLLFYLTCFLVCLLVNQ